jgi:hypothetical protein
MAVGTRYIDCLTLVEGVAGAAHQTDARMTVDATHACKIVRVGRHAFDMSAIRQAQARVSSCPVRSINLCQTRVAQ